ncbi:hypothetical protein Tco_0853093 [Tanacetum coccineum]
MANTQRIFWIQRIDHVSFVVFGEIQALIRRIFLDGYGVLEELSTQAPSLLTVPVMIILKTSTLAATTVPPTILPFTPIPQQSTPTPTPKTEILPKEVSDLATPVIQSTINESLKNVVLAKSSSQPKSTYEAAASLTEFELKKILLDKFQKSKSYRGAKEHRDLYNALVKSYQLDKDLFESYGKAYSLKRDREGKDKDEDPPAGSDQGLKKRKTSKDAEPSKGSKSKESRSSSSSKGTKSQPKSSGKSVQAEESVFEAADTEMPQNQGSDIGHTDDQPDNAKKTIDFRQPQTWINKIAHAEKPPLTFDELMSTHINFSTYVMNNLKIENLTQEHLNNPEGHEYPFDLNKPLPLIKDRGRQVVPADYFFNSEFKYLKGIEDMVPTLWSPVKLYKFKEGDFLRLKLRDIEDMLLLLVQKKILNLERDVIYDLNVALRMFTRRVVIQKRVEDLQLGVESYQKKLNITRPETIRSNISNMTPYTAYKNPQGFIYQDKLKRNSLMHSDELYKFCDGTLTSVRSVLHDIASDLRMD